MIKNIKKKVKNMAICNITCPDLVGFLTQLWYCIKECYAVGCE